MKRNILVFTCLTLTTLTVLECGRKKSTDPVAKAFDEAIVKLRATKDPKTAAATVDALTTSLSEMKEKNPKLLEDRLKYQDAKDEFIKVFAQTMVDHPGNPDFEASQNKLMTLGLLQ